MVYVAWIKKAWFSLLLIGFSATLVSAQRNSTFFISASAGDFRPFVNSTSFEEYDFQDNLAFGGEIGYQWRSKFRVVLKALYFSRKGYPMTFTCDYGDWQYVRDGNAFFQQWIYSLNFGAVFWESKTFRLSLLSGTSYMVVKRKHERTKDLNYASYYDATGKKSELGITYSAFLEIKLKTKKVSPFIEINGSLNKFLPTMLFFDEFGGFAFMGGVRYFFRTPE